MRLIRGAPGSGKSALVLGEFQQALRENRELARTALRIVVPTATLVRHVQHELARRGEVFPPGCVISLSRFLAELAPERKLTPTGLLRAFVRRALKELNLPEFSEVAATEGMTSTVLDTIGLFENAGCSTDQLGKLRKLSAHGKAFARLWRAVEESVRASGFATRLEIVRTASAAEKPSRVWMDGFLSFSPLEGEFLRALANSCDLTLTVTDSPAGDEIRRLGLEIRAEERLLQGRSRKPAAIEVSAVSMEREADEVARRILKLHETGTPFREIGIALRDQPAYLPLLRGTMERFGIPARFYFADPLRTHPAAVFLGGLISSVINGWEFGAALEALRSDPRCGKTPAFDRFDFKVREAMPSRSAEALLGLCQEALPGRDERWLHSRIAECVALDVWKSERHLPAAWAQRLEEMALSLYRPEVLESPADHQAVASARSHVAAVRAWVGTIREIAPVWQDAEQEIGLEQFWKVACEALDSTTIQIPDDRRDVVHVMSVYEARQWDVAALFVCGMTDRDFPKRNPQNLLFADAEIDSVLRKAGIPVRRASDLDRDEAALFETLRTRARDCLTLTWPEHDAGGKSVESSRHLSLLDIQVEKSKNCRPLRRGDFAASSGAQGKLDSPALLTFLSSQHRRISLTGLEDLSQCLFKFFVGRTLGLKGRPERPDERIQARVSGLILHEALELWLKSGRSGDFADHFEAAFERACIERRLPRGYKLETEHIELRDVARKVSATEKWECAASDAEVELSLDFPQGITISGRVDRIDRLNDHDCIIVDYKSGNTQRVRNFLDSKVKLQGPLYALAARERLNLNTIAMMYVAIREDKRFGWGDVPGSGLQLRPIPPNWMEDARARTIDRLDSFLAGAIRAEPADTENCVFCDFRNACRYSGQEALKTEGTHAD